MAGSRSWEWCFYRKLRPLGRLLPSDTSLDSSWLFAAVSWGNKLTARRYVGEDGAFKSSGEECEDTFYPFQQSGPQQAFFQSAYAAWLKRPFCWCQNDLALPRRSGASWYGSGAIAALWQSSQLTGRHHPWGQILRPSILIVLFNHKTRDARAMIKKNTKGLSIKPVNRRQKDVDAHWTHTRISFVRLGMSQVKGGPL